MIVDFGNPSLADLLHLGIATLFVAIIAVAVLIYRKPRIDPVDLAEIEERYRALEAALEALDHRQRESAEARDSRLRLELSEALSSAIKRVGEMQHQQLESVENRIGALTEASQQSQERLRETLDRNLQALRAENEAKLEKMRETVDEKLQGTLEKRLSASFQSVSERLESVHKGLGEMQSLASGVGDLRKLLSGVKTRGTFGEEQLGALLEQFLSPAQIVRNARTREGSSEAVEYAIRLPEDVLLPVDCKFPQEDYERLLLASEQGDAAGVEQAGAALEKRLRDEAKKIAAKYVNPPQTTDFAVLFVPTEGLFAEIVRRPGLREQIQRDHRVTVLGPTTLGAFLSSLNMGFRTLAIQQKSAEVWQVLGAVKTEFAKYGDLIDKVRKKLGESENVLHDIGKRTRAIHARLRHVEAVPDDGGRMTALSDPDQQGDLLAADEADRSV